MVAIGGGHGLAATVRACRSWAGELTAIVSVADDGGSSGRLRQAQPGLPALGDLRRCVTALADPERSTLAAALEHRFTSGELAGHPPGNLLLAALVEETGDLESAAEVLCTALGVSATVLPATCEAVDLVGLSPDGAVYGQVQVEAVPGVTDIRLEPPDPAVPKAALAALGAADLVVLGPGSFFGSVLAALGAPRLSAAVAASPARRVLVFNLSSPATPAERLAVLGLHGVRVDVVIVQAGSSDEASAHDGAPPRRPSPPVVAGVPAEVRIVQAAVARSGGLAHDSARLAEVLRGL